MIRKNNKNRKPFYKNLATGLAIFSGYSVVITFFITFFFWFILPGDNLSMGDWLAPESDQPLPLIDHLISHFKIGSISLFIFLILLLISSFFLRKGKKWARFSTLLLLIAPVLLIIYSTGLLISQWSFFCSIPVPFWVSFLVIALIISLGIVLTFLSIQLVRSNPVNK